MEAAKLRGALQECRKQNNHLMNSWGEVSQMFLNHSKEKIISLLKEYDTALHCAAYLGDVALLRAVLSTLSAQDCLENLKGSTPTPLHVAASQGRIESVRVILEYVPDPKKQNELLETTDEEQRRPLDLVPPYRNDIMEMLKTQSSKGSEDGGAVAKPEVEIRKLPGSVIKLDDINRRMKGSDRKVVYEIVSLTDKLMALEKKVEEQRQDHILHKITELRSEPHSRTSPLQSDTYISENKGTSLITLSQGDMEQNVCTTPIGKIANIILKQMEEADGLSDNPKPDSHAIPGSLKSSEVPTGKVSPYKAADKAEVAGGATKFPLTNGHSSVYTENRATPQSQDQIDEKNELPPTGIVAKLIRQTEERSFDKQ